MTRRYGRGSAVRQAIAAELAANEETLGDTIVDVTERDLNNESRDLFEDADLYPQARSIYTALKEQHQTVTSWYFGINNPTTWHDAMFTAMCDMAEDDMMLEADREPVYQDSVVYDDYPSWYDDIDDVDDWPDQYYNGDFDYNVNRPECGGEIAPNKHSLRQKLGSISRRIGSALR